MKRTTISLPDELAAALEREARRKRVPISQIAREAIEMRLRHQREARRKLPFVALGASGHKTTSQDIEEILKAEWTVDRDR